MSKDRPVAKGSNIWLSEYACHHCGTLPVGLFDDEGEMDPARAILFQAFEKIRAGRGGTELGVTSGYRCRDHEKALFLDGIKPGANVTKAFMSVHPFGLALDVQGKDKADQDLIVRLARALKPIPRIGWRDYRKNGSFIVHIDYGYLIEPRYSPDLEPGVEW